MNNVPATRWFLLSSGRKSAAENMAWDEALLEAVSGWGRPVLRRYGWTEPAATFGYFQKLAEVERMTTLRPLVRRCTGGGMVPHDRDWTYSLAVPPSDPWYDLKAVESYQRVHDWICAAFQRVGNAAELAASCQKAIPGSCFAGAERFDVVSGGRKIAGAAQRRTRAGLLIQGSIQPPAGVEREDFERAWLAEAGTRWGVEWAPLVSDDRLLERVQALAVMKYANPGYNAGR